MNLKNGIALAISSCLLTVGCATQAGRVEVRGNQLWTDNQPQPQLFGAEVQYFRMRGGFEPNVPRAEVIALWTKALDRLVEAKMNAISFYIPWDFHEYAPGKFDFDGTVDEDGDGNPDYPSRDIQTFFKMIEARGIKHIMVRPGPYVNAEWGFLGFGAIPYWFHEKYPDSHMRNSQGLRTKLYDYANPDLLRHTQLWFAEVYKQVLKSRIGPGKPIDFVQIDNETNYMWQSLYNHDYSPATRIRYQVYLHGRYQNLENLNTAHGRKWTRWEDITLPTSPGQNVAEDQDWYRFADDTIYVYLNKIRQIWENLGVREPDIMFTLADSYNATQFGLLPNYDLHNQAGITGLLTVNLYPKTYETNDKPLLNLPFKADHDVKAAEAASEHYLGKGNHWALGPEIQGGWWRGIEVTGEARQQTYLTVLGHGLKALFVYYFNEGDQWQSDWAKKQIAPIYASLRAEPPYAALEENQLPEAFWNTLQQRSDRQVIAGFDVRFIMHEDTASNQKLYFDAPLDHKANPRPHYYQLKEIGEKIIAPHADWLSKADPVTDPVCLIKDTNDHVPNALSKIDSILMNSDWSAGLIAFALRAGVNVKVVHWGINSPDELDACRVILHQDRGFVAQDFAKKMKDLLAKGHTVINFLQDSLAMEVGIQIPQASVASNGPVNLAFKGQNFTSGWLPLYHWAMPANSRCDSTISHDGNVSGYHCTVGKGEFYQVGSPIYEPYNSNQYAWLSDLPARELFLKSVLSSAKVVGTIQVEADRVVAFARRVNGSPSLWITVKSSSAGPLSTPVKVAGLAKDQNFTVRNLLNMDQQTLSGAKLAAEGFTARLDRFGSTVYFLEPAIAIPRAVAVLR